MVNGTATATNGNADQTDAVLVEASGHDQTFEVASSDWKDGLTKQTWHYPSRSECMVCHSRASNFVLGRSVQQTNLTFTDDEHTVSQLEQFKQLGFVSCCRIKGQERINVTTPFKFPSAVEDLPKLTDPADTSQALESLCAFLLAFQLRELSRQRRGCNSKITLRINRPLDKTGILDARHPTTPLHH